MSLLIDTILPITRPIVKPRAETSSIEQKPGGFAKDSSIGKQI